MQCGSLINGSLTVKPDSSTRACARRMTFNRTLPSMRSMRILSPSTRRSTPFLMTESTTTITALGVARSIIRRVKSSFRAFGPRQITSKGLCTNLPRSMVWRSMIRNQTTSHTLNRQRFPPTIDGLGGVFGSSAGRFVPMKRDTGNWGVDFSLRASQFPRTHFATTRAPTPLAPHANRGVILCLKHGSIRAVTPISLCMLWFPYSVRCSNRLIRNMPNMFLGGRSGSERRSLFRWWGESGFSGKCPRELHPVWGM